MNPQDIVAELSDAVAILEAFLAQNPAAAIVPALDAVKRVLVALPPIDAKDLLPEDRAAVDVAIDAEETAKVGPP